MGARYSKGDRPGLYLRLHDEHGAKLDFQLQTQQSYRLGRQADCDICLDSQLYNTVSRYHSQLELLGHGSDRHWYLRDLQSANGTFLNGQRLSSQPQRLHIGDQINLGKTGARFYVLDIVEPFPSTPEPPPKAASAPMTRSIAPNPPPVTHHQTTSTTPNPAPAAPVPRVAATFTQLFPILSTGPKLGEQTRFIAGSITVTLGVSLFMAFGHPFVFNGLLALYLSLGLYYLFIYQLCQKPKHPGVLGLMALSTMLFLKSPALDPLLWFFRQVLPGSIDRQVTDLSLGELLGRTFLGTGLMEELIKVLPILILLILGSRLSPTWQRRWGIADPLDGILLCTASALGFTLMETLGQYVPQITQEVAGSAGLEAGQLAGLQLLIPRVLGSIAGHLAYSGYFGYFLGLGQLFPQQQVFLWVLGYFSAALLHTFWNVAGSLNPVLLAISGLLSYSLLMAAILKARTLEDFPKPS